MRRNIKWPSVVRGYRNVVAYHVQKHPVQCVVNVWNVGVHAVAHCAKSIVWCVHV